MRRKARNLIGARSNKVLGIMFGLYLIKDGKPWKNFFNAMTWLNLPFS